MNWTEYKSRCKRFLWFSKKELWYLFLLVLVFAFIVSFDMWGVDSFDAKQGFNNLMISFVMVAIVVLIHHFAQRFVCLLFAFKPQHRIWWPGLIISLFLVFLSNGRFTVFLGSVFAIAMSKTHRIGWLRYGLNVKQQGLIAVSGNIAVILFIGLIQLLFPLVPGSFLARMVWFSILFVIFNMLPIPPLDGGLMFLGSRLYFVFLFGAIIGILAFMVYGLLLALFLGLLIGVIAWILFYWYYERFWD